MASTLPTELDTAAGSLESHTGRTLLFRVGSAVYGCELAAVREIVPFRRATRLPGAPPYVHGLMNLRGTIVTVVDAGARLEAGRAPVADGSIILIEYGTRVAGLAVEEVLDVRLVALDPDTLGEGAAGPEGSAGVVRGVGRVDDTVVVLLDAPMLVRQVLLT